MSKHVAVLMGGWSAEREVSLRSGRACADALTRLGYRVTRIDVGRDIATVLGTVNPDVALNVLHGRPGEDGTLQGMLEVLAIPYTHSGVMASAVAMQKDVAKELFRAAGVPVAEGLIASRFDAANAHLLPPPYVVKPIAEGSSVGVFIVAEDHTQILRLPGQVRARRIETPLAGPCFTNCLPTGPKTSAGGASCARLSGREPGGLPLRRPDRGDGRVGLSRGQYTTWHDGDVARARAGGERWHFVR